jgi:hypothetical protein
MSFTVAFFEKSGYSKPEAAGSSRKQPEAFKGIFQFFLVLFWFARPIAARPDPDKHKPHQTWICSICKRGRSGSVLKKSLQTSLRRRRAADPAFYVPVAQNLALQFHSCNNSTAIF